MANRVMTARNENPGKVFLWASVVLACLGALDAIYLVIYKYTGDSRMCLGNGGCHNVNFSPYSMIAGIPVAVYGLAAYVVIIAILLLEPRMRLAHENGPLAVFGISLGGVAFTAYLTWLEFYVIHAVCPFCVASAVIITLIFILAIIRLVKQTA
jgi:uncharacterized membrane protein